MKLKRGFFTGLAAVLVMLFLSGMLAISQTHSNEKTVSLIQLQALKVFHTMKDALAFANATVDDALLDAAAQAHGCAPSGDFCTIVRDKTTSYTQESSNLILEEGLRVVMGFTPQICNSQAVPKGFDISYFVQGSVSISVESPNAKKTRAADFTRQVDVNITTMLMRVRSEIIERNVQVTCQA